MKSALQSIRPLEYVSLATRVHSELAGLLIGGKLSPGEKLSLRKVAETMGVSMMPVREAVTRLVAEDALVVLPNRAVSVPVMTRRKMQELMIVRSEIEGFAAARAALQRTEPQLRAMRSLDEQFRKAVSGERPDADRALRLNKDLHFVIYEASGLPMLTDIIQGLWLKIGPVINLDLRSSEQRLRSGHAEQFHARLVQAMADREPEAARLAIVADIETSSRFIQQTGNLPE
ncbi:MAG: GntR family transcriptional regulator [Microvirga sp.]